MLRASLATSALLACVVFGSGCDLLQEASGADEPKAAADADSSRPAAGPAVGTERGPCYGNSTCNDGLECRSELCVQASPPPADAPAKAPVVVAAAAPEASGSAKPSEPAPSVPTQPDPSPADAAAEPALTTATTFDDGYLGEYGFGVNRVNDGRRSARATISGGPGALHLHATVAKGRFDSTIEGAVQPISDREFVVIGSLSGTPDLRWDGKRPKPQSTEGRFTFERSGRRSYWRLTRVDDRRCICNDGCGNDFCYVDIGPKK